MRHGPANGEVASRDVNVLMTNARVKRLGVGAAVVSYIRLQQHVDSETGKPVVVNSSETRVWQKMNDGLWRCVHFHRS